MKDRTSSDRAFLVVDDNEDNRFLVRHSLLKAFPGAQVVEAVSGDEAVAAAARCRFDGVVTDHHLGANDSIEFMRRLRAAGVDCPVIMVTASSDPRVHRRAYEAGAARVFAGSEWRFVDYLKGLLASSSP